MLTSKKPDGHLRFQSINKFSQVQSNLWMLETNRRSERIQIEDGQ